MAVTLGQAMVVVQVDNSKLTTGLNAAKNDTQRAAQQMQGSFNGVGSAIGALGSKLLAVAAAAVGLREVINGIVEVTKAANNATETQNKFEVAFRRARGEAEKSLTAFSNLAGGLNVYALKEYASGFQLLFNAMELAPDKTSQMSTELAKLSYDLASLYNSSIEEAFTRLQSGLVGETEAVRRFGVDVSEAALRQELLRQGIDKNFESLSQAEKVMLRYNMIMRQTSDAQGDLARTQTSGANVLRRFGEQFERVKIEIGQGFRKVIEAVGPRILNFIQTIDFKKVVANVAAVFYQMYQRIKPFIAFLVSGFMHFYNAVKDSLPIVIKFLNVLEAAKWGAIAGAIGGVLHILGAGINILNRVAIAFIDTTKAIAEAHKRLLEFLGGKNSRMYGWMDNISKSMDDLKKSFDYKDFNLKSLDDLAKGAQQESALANKLRETYTDNSAYRETAEAISEIIDARKEDIKTEAERRRQAIGFVQGREMWDKMAVAGERERFAAKPAQNAGSNAGVMLGINSAMVSDAYNYKQGLERLKAQKLDRIVEMLEKIAPGLSAQPEQGYGQ